MAFSSLVWICQSSPSGRGTGREIEFLSPSLSTQLIGRDSEIPPAGSRFGDRSYHRGEVASPDGV